jgi:hypothetical protein
MATICASLNRPFFRWWLPGSENTLFSTHTWLPIWGSVQVQLGVVVLPKFSIGFHRDILVSMPFILSELIDFSTLKSESKCLTYMSFA